MLTQITAWFTKKRFLQASESGNRHKVRSLIREVDQETKDAGLIRAANNGHEDTVKMLLDEGADSEAKDDQGFTALIWAAYQGYEDALQTMLTFGVNPDQRTKDGRTALMWAIKAGRMDSVACFVESGNADFEAKDGLGFTALIHAAYNGHNEIVNALINAGADPNFRTDHNETALMWAADRGQSKTVQILVDAGADPSAADNDGKTVLMWAATQKHGRTGNYVPGVWTSTNGGLAVTKANAGVMGNDFLEINTIKILLDAGAELNAQDNNGETALSKATQARYPEIVRTLQEASATS